MMAGGYTVKELQTGSGNKNLEDQRPQTTGGEDRKPPSDRLIGSKRNRKKQHLRTGVKSSNGEPSIAASSNLGNSYRNNNVIRSTSDGPTGSCNTQRTVAGESSSGRYDLVNGDNYTTVDNKPSPRHLMTSSDSSAVFCSGDICDNGKKCLNEMLSDPGIRDNSLEAMCSNDHPTVLVVNG